MFNFFKKSKLYSLHHSRGILKTLYAWYKKKGKKTLDPEAAKRLEEDLEQLDQAILNKNQVESDRLARKLEAFEKTHVKKSFFDYAWELTIALTFALVIATVVRQSWFEPYEIPTGSMRPTFEEQDHLTVSKLAFGINIPLKTDHFYFDPNLVQRTGVVTFTGEGMPIIDQDTTYFGIFPYKKRYIKRLIAKPGDTVYFYGGKLYILDKDNHLLTELLDSPWLQGLEHIPFLTFEGLITAPTGSYILFKQMHQPIGKITPLASGILGEVFNGTTWIKDDPIAQKTAHNTIKTYSDFFGMRNFAMARLLTKQQLPAEAQKEIEGSEDAILYLELRHTPSLSYPKPRIQQDSRGVNISITPYVTYIPLQQHHLDAMMDHMYTARFTVLDGRATRYNVEGNRFNSNSPSFPNVENGTYEFYYGKASRVGWGGILHTLPSDFPLYSHRVENIQKLFNIGIEMDLTYAPNGKNPYAFPQRYAYFRDGDLYLLGAPILKKEDPTLVKFNQNEKTREEKSTASTPYIGFKDYGPPITPEGSPDTNFIQTFGVKIPEKRYMMLGDNHAMSSDSRIFGFVPQQNMQGAPCLILWPPGDRIGHPMQKPYPIINLPRLIVWGIVLLILALWYVYRRYSMTQPVIRK